MKRLLLLLGACTPATDPPWQLDHDRILAVRANPPALMPGEVGRLEILVAHAGDITSVEEPDQVGAPGSPLFTAVHFNLDHWEIDAPDEMQLAAARTELHLPVDAPVPLDLQIRVAGLNASKEVLLGATAMNPALPPVTLPAFTPGEHTLLIEAGSVRWFTSCGELVDADQPRATLVLDGPCTGELAVVVRDGIGVVWNVWPIP
jgi:hypothetical protein